MIYLDLMKMIFKVEHNRISLLLFNVSLSKYADSARVLTCNDAILVIAYYYANPMQLCFCVRGTIVMDLRGTYLPCSVS